MSKGVRTVRTPSARERFLDTLAETSNVSAACDAASISRVTAYTWRGEDAGFASAWKNALEIATDTLEAEARRRALEGVEEPVVSQGRIVKDEHGNALTVRRYSDSLMLALLKAHRPERYRDKDGGGNTAILIQITDADARL